MIDPTLLHNVILSGPIFGYLLTTQEIPAGLILYGFYLLIILAVPISIMIYYDGDWSSFLWYTINTIIMSIGFVLFLIPGIIIFIIWAKRAGIIVPLLALTWPLGPAVASSMMNYESEGFLS